MQSVKVLVVFDLMGCKPVALVQLVKSQLAVRKVFAFEPQCVILEALKMIPATSMSGI